MPSRCIGFARCLRGGGILGPLVFRLLMNACSLTAKKRSERGSTTRGRSCAALYDHLAVYGRRSRYITCGFGFVHCCVAAVACVMNGLYIVVGAINCQLLQSPLCPVSVSRRSVLALLFYLGYVPKLADTCILLLGGGYESQRDRDRKRSACFTYRERLGRYLYSLP